MKAKDTKASELKTKSPEELKKLLQDKLLEQFNLRMQRGSGQIIPQNTLKYLRRDIARIKTIIHEKQGETA
jgi:large subunit ribosomal protein L29